MGNPTELLARWKSGDESALAPLIDQLYEQLRSVAVQQLRRQWSNARLQPTELVNEAFIKVQHLHHIDWQDRLHFIAVVSKVMRQVLTDQYRRENAHKREHERITLATAHLDDEQDQVYEFGHLITALEEFADVSAELAEIVELRFFGGMTHKEIATLKGSSERTVKRQWRLARAWLQDRLAHDLERG